MYLKTVYVRFYKSFNFDYLRKYHPGANADAWESIGSMWYPYVRISIDRRITTIVGENESGKTHLLTAIERGLSGEGIELKDFCRYSRFFTVEQDKMRLPDFGFEWAGLADDEARVVREVCGAKKSFRLNSFLLFRTEGKNLTAYLPGAETKAVAIAEESRDVLLGILPSVFRLYTNIKLPEAVPLRSLISPESSPGVFERLNRENREDLFESVSEWDTTWFKSVDTLAPHGKQIIETISKISGIGFSDDARKRAVAELGLARDLIIKIARIDISALEDLRSALISGRDAFANSLIQKINDALDEYLNFPKWWAQDSEFELKVTARDYDLVFTISDRTKKEYSFGERSSGLRFFLSYYIQYRSHEPQGQRPEILLMDEPDAYLSSQGQQDLLKIFEAFAEPVSGKVPTQVVYVTHSPFLIDKNHAERIRVLQKGEDDEGTRVVHNASRNHYEPLRSSFGSFVAETTFIGNCNLMTEGVADQVLLAGASVYLRSLDGISHDLETLDLNQLTIVPASSATHIPYLVYLARGRDVEKPAVIVLLDSDKEGDRAKRGILKAGVKRRPLIDQSLIMQIGEIADELEFPKGAPLVETEDLIPLEICAKAASQYLVEICGFEATDAVTADAVAKKLKSEKTTFKALQACVSELEGSPHIEKIGFARLVVDVVRSLSLGRGGDFDQALRKFENNMKALFRRINSMKRQALRALHVNKVATRVKREKKSFLNDHPEEATRSDVFLLFEDIETVLKQTRESDEIRFEMARIRRDFKIDDDLTELVDDYDRFRERLERLTYSGVMSVQEEEIHQLSGTDEDSEEISSQVEEASSQEDVDAETD